MLVFGWLQLTDFGCVAVEVDMHKRSLKDAFWGYFNSFDLDKIRLGIFR